MTMTIDQLIQSGVDQAKRVLVGVKGAELVPTFVVQFNDRPPAIVASPWSNDDEKTAAIQAMRMMLKLYRANVESYLFWTEAWMAHEDIDHPINLMPRDREDREEVVIINAFDKQGGKISTLDIVRGSDGAVVDLIEKKLGEYDRFEGRLVNLLKED